MLFYMNCVSRQKNKKLNIKIQRIVQMYKKEKRIDDRPFDIKRIRCLSVGEIDRCRDIQK